MLVLRPSTVQIELTTIFIASVVGLKMGYALIAPTQFTRKRALTDAAKTTVQLIEEYVVLIIITGIIERFVSPSSFPSIVKIGFGFATGVLLFCYLLLMKEPNRQPVPTDRGD